MSDGSYTAICVDASGWDAWLEVGHPYKVKPGPTSTSVYVLTGREVLLGGTWIMMAKSRFRVGGETTVRRPRLQLIQGGKR